MKIYDLMSPKEEYYKVLKQREIDGIAFYEKYHKDFVLTNCPACGEGGINSFEKYGFEHKTCKNCKTLFVSPRPTDEILSIYYNEYSAPKMWTELLLKTDVQRKAMQYLPRVEMIINRIRNLGINKMERVVDLGAGSGAFSICLQKSGFFDEVIAIDLSEECVKACQSQGLKTILGSVENIEDESIDLICMNDLFEHLFDCSKMLSGCFRALKKNGFISIATPNGEGFDFKIMKKNTVNITPPEHLNYFNPISMEISLSKAGFMPILVETPGKLDVEIVLREKFSGFSLSERNEYINYLLEQEEQVINNFQEFLSKNKLSSHMFAMAQKK